MPYALTGHEVDFSGVLLGKPVTASIFSPPAQAGGILGTPTGTAMAISASTFILAFTSPAVPPAAALDMLVSDTTVPSKPGDLFRSGQLSALPSSPGTLNLTAVPVPTVAPSAPGYALQQQLPQTFPIPDDVKNLVGFIMAGSMFPQSVTVYDATLTVGNPSIVTASGSLDIKFFDLWDQSSGFTLTGTVLVGPSHDPLDTSRVAKITASVSSTDLVLDTLLLLPPAALLIGAFMGSALASKLEAWLNGRIAELAADALAHFSPPMQLTSTAVISLGRLAVDSDGLHATVVAGDLFGPGIEPIPIPKYISVEVTPQWKCGVAESYTITVRDAADGSPIPGAQVSLTSGEVRDRTKTFERHATADAAGVVEFSDIALSDWVVRIPQAHGAPEWKEFQPVLQVSARWFNPLTLAIDCPPLTADG